MPAERAVGVRTFGRACLRVRGDCERFSRARSRIRSMAAPRRRQDRSATRSTISGSACHSPAGTRWQYNAVVRGQRCGATPKPRMRPTRQSRVTRLGIQRATSHVRGETVTHRYAPTHEPGPECSFLA
jgi:hypothetical protein